MFKMSNAKSEVDDDIGPVTAKKYRVVLLWVFVGHKIALRSNHNCLKRH